MTTTSAALRSPARYRPRFRSARIFQDLRRWRPRSGRRASDYVMPDLERIGGVTGWQRAAGLAQARASKCRLIFSRRSARICSP